MRPRAEAVTALLLLSLAFIPPATAGECDGLQADVVGTWEWVSTASAWGGPPQTPETEGYTEWLDVRSDGTYDRYRDGALVVTDVWEVVPSFDLLTQEFQGCRMNVYYLGFRYYWGAFSIEEEVMMIDQSEFDGIIWTFRRSNTVTNEPTSWGDLKAQHARTP